MSRFFKPDSAAALLPWAQAAIKFIAIAVAAGLPLGGAVALAGDHAALLDEGRALYRGNAPWRQPATLHGVPLVAGASACAACHGARGEARTEAGVSVPAIQWQRLQQPTPTRPGYSDARQVLRALIQGHASDGRTLQAPMPRFTLDARERQALIAYLRALGTDADAVPGIEPQRIVLGTVLPISGPSAAIGERIRVALERSIDSVNAGGGIFGRQLALVVVDAGPTTASASSAAVEMVRSGRVFALVASLLPSPDTALRRALVDYDAAMVATLGLPLAESGDPRVTYLLSSLTQQTRELAAELQRRCGPPEADSAVLLLHESGSALATALAEQSGPSWQLQPIADEAQLRAVLRASRARRTLALVPTSLAAVARAELAQRAGPHPACLGTLAALSGEAPASAMLRELVALPMPPVPLPSGADSSVALWPLLADAALAVTAEALARAGRRLDTARLVAALGTLHRFEAQPGLALGFDARRRHAIDITYLLKESAP